MKEAVPYAAPLLVFAAFVIVQKVEWFTGQMDLSETDVVVIARPANDAARRLEALVRSPGWYVSSRRRHGVNEITVYERSASGGRGA